MGYGGDLGEGIVTKGTGDHGIDGIIKQDPFGLDNIYIQAKRWKKKVGEPELRDFFGALQMQPNAKRGVFATTSDYTQPAKNALSRIDAKIVLINGEQLVELMIKYRIGIYKRDSYPVYDIDSDYLNLE